MTKPSIVDEIRRLATANGGKPPGEKLFRSETGIRPHEWRGKYWARWGDALRDAGYEANKWVEGFDESLLIEKYIELIRELGRFPLHSELSLKTNNDPSYPSMSPFRRLGRQSDVQRKLLDYCAVHDGFGDVREICEKLQLTPAKIEVDAATKAPDNDGFVYLLKSGRHYKIGRSVSVGQRERQLAIQLPEKVTTIHSIKTDDPVGIEAYWHKRFASKRKNGEWFELDSSDIGIFKRRKFM